ncbi:MAG: GNAT family N-acetyltransferase [Clostridiaceae bacterium]|nr:GNAT family N-acetyltransferase [Clostridiaceae bacterium]
MVIREIRKSELKELLSLYEYLKSDDIPKESNELNDIWGNILNYNGQHIIVAEEDNKIVSSCVVTIIPNLTHNHKSYALVENVVTNENYTKRGFATACLNYAKELAIKENCYKLMLLTGSKRESTLKFYEQAGYNKNDKTAFIQWIE